MISRYYEIKGLAEYTAKRVTGNEHEWKKFLETAGRMYRYNFDDQLLIYAQKPGATACASMDIWNDKMKCWVNRGAKGIALIDDDSRNRLRYVFDAADVHELRDLGHKPKLWKMSKEHEEAVISDLESVYGSTDREEPFETRVWEIADRIAEDMTDELIGDQIDMMTEGSRLNGLDYSTISTNYRETLTASIAYAVLSRCGANDEIKETVRFPHISDFNTVNSLSVLGWAASELSEPVLIGIGRSIANYERNRVKEAVKAARDEFIGDNEKNTEKALANAPEHDYNALKRKSAGGTIMRSIIQDGSDDRPPTQREGAIHIIRGRSDYADRIHSERGLSDTKPHSEQRTGGATDEVRPYEEELPEGTQERDIHGNEAPGNPEGALPEDTETGRAEDGSPDRTDGEVAGSERSPENIRPDEVGGSDEQHPGIGGGDSFIGADLQIEDNIPVQLTMADLFPSFEEQIGTIITAEAGMKTQAPAVITLKEEQLLDIIRTGGGNKDSRKRIYAKYRAGKTAYEMTDFIRNEIGTTGKGFEFEGQRVSVWFDDNGMSIAWGSSARIDTADTYSWERVEELTRRMIEEGTYMSRTEAFLVDSVEYSRVADDIFFFFRDGLDGMPEAFGIMANNYPDCEEHIAELLSNHDGREFLAGEIKIASDRLERGETKLRWKYVKDPKYLLSEIADLDAVKTEFPLKDEIHILQESFITQDEIDSVLTGGSGVSEGKKRIYEHFRRGRDKKDNIAFLKSEYGTGGRSHALIGSDKSWEDHDSRGIKLSKGSIMAPYAEVVLSWNVIEKRIRELVAEDRYLSRAEKEEIESGYLEEAAEELSSMEKEQEIIIPKIPDASEIENIDVLGIDNTAAENYRITDDRLGTGSPKEKFKRNIAAIETLKKIEGENRAATSEEQDVLSQYVGWGGLADAFDDTKSSWTEEYRQLKGLLTDEEYKAARESTLNAHYTSPVIIRSIYEALSNMGFEKGNILEPAMGIGNFFGMLPKTMQESRLYGVELDSITGRIAKQLYPKADIKIRGYEKTDFQNDFFDIAIGNVPFGNYKVSDKPYDKLNFQIHDYFFAKTLDKVRPGGIIAFVTSKGTMDKQSPQVRKYLAQRAELIGAVRLPNTAFKENAGTEVTSDILFLKKRDRIMDIEPDWVHLGMNDQGITVNSYFINHPEMMIGKMAEVSGPFGTETACLPDVSDPARPFEVQLREAIGHIRAEYEPIELEEEGELSYDVIPADPDIRNYSYCIVENKVYYRENSIMKPAEVSESMEARIKGLIGLRDCTQELIRMQIEEYSDEEIAGKQRELNDRYDAFTEENGLISSRTNKRTFDQDSSYCLLCSLEQLDDEGNFKGKADMFTKRTIKRAEVVTSVDTVTEALAVSLAEKAKVDLDFMEKLTGKPKEQITDELTGVIFKNPVTEKWETNDEYLSGNVREKLKIARDYAQNNPEYTINVVSLEQVQPKDLDASEIEVRIGATWIDTKYIEDFMREIFKTPEYLFFRDITGVQYSPITGQWNIKGKNSDYGNALVNTTYGTGRVNAYKILEDSLNLRDTRVYDIIVENGKERRELNKKETTLAAQKQEAIREAFKDWIFRDPERRAVLCTKYNKLFNSIRPREYDGLHLKFPGMTPDIELKPHQLNAVAHILYGNNTLLAHCVGAGKTYEIAAAAMESKRLGLCRKSLIVVPNHLTEQWASEFLRLYPGANILAATKKDFEPANRKKFCSRIATGDYDAVIIGHTQFERIPLSTERQIAIIEKQIDDIETAISLAKAEKGERYTIKEMEKSRKSLVAKLDKLNDQTRKDNVVTFEQLGVDRLFVDESHGFKNLFLYTKMRNVAGIAQTEAQKSQDMFNKCRYLDELTGGKGVTFATGTPISNSMTELYTNMRYLQYSTLEKMGMLQFDAWAATFGEVQTSIELAPEGTGYRAKTRFSKFFNLPELIALFKECADIQTPDMLKLPVPEAEYENVTLKPSEAQKEMVQSLADRADRVRNRMVDSSIDNMLKITNDGRKLALDQRLMNEILPDDPNSKANTCVQKAYEIWKETSEKRSTQLIFSDLSTPKGDGSFNIYDDIREKLVEKGVPREEIAFIHEANTELRKAELFAKVRSGQVRFLLGSTSKMGAGTNVQDRLIALHHLDVPWRPSDIEQQEGRIIRQGNMNSKVKIFRYITESTFDSYSWQLIENKQKFIGQIMTSKSPVRSCEDIDDAALTYAEVKALATGNPYIKEKMQLDIEVAKLKLLKSNHTSQQYRLEDDIATRIPKQISALKEQIEGLEADIELYDSCKHENSEQFRMIVADKEYDDKKEAGTALIELCREMKGANQHIEAGKYLEMKMLLTFDAFSKKFSLTVKGQLSHTVDIGADAYGNITRINNLLDGMEMKLEEAKVKLDNAERQLETAKAEVNKPFEKEEELKNKQQRLAELDALLNMDEKEESDKPFHDLLAAKKEQAAIINAGTQIAIKDKNISLCAV